MFWTMFNQHFPLTIASPLSHYSTKVTLTKVNHNFHAAVPDDWLSVFTLRDLSITHSSADHLTLKKFFKLLIHHTLMVFLSHFLFSSLLFLPHLTEPLAWIYFFDQPTSFFSLSAITLVLISTIFMAVATTINFLITSKLIVLA